MKQEDQQTILNKYKLKIFDYTKQLVSNDFNVRLYIFFIIIENLQYLGYHNNGLIQYGPLGITQLAQITKYLNWMTFMMYQDINIYFVPLFSLISLAHIVLIVIGYRAYNQKKSNNQIHDKNFHKNRIDFFINFLMISFNTFLTIPIFQTSITSLICISSSPYCAKLNCYEGDQIIIAILALINVIWLLFTNIFYSLYYYSRNPFFTNVQTCSSNWWNIGKFVIKILPMIYFTYDSTLNYSVLFQIVMAASYGLYIALFRILIRYYHYNFNLEKIIFIIQIFTFMVNICFCLIFALKNIFPSDKPTFIFIGWTIMSAYFTKILLELIINSKKNLITDLHSVQKKKISKALQYIIYIIYETQKTLQQNKGGFYIGAIYKLHKQKCKNLNCYCINLKQQFKKPNYFKNKKVFYIMILSIIDNIIIENKKAYQFFILKAYILYYKMQSEIKAASTIASIMSNKLDFSDQMLVKGLLFELDRQYTDTRDMQIYRKFNNCLLAQEQQSINIAYYYMQFWSQLIDQQSSLPKLYNLLDKIKKGKKRLYKVIQQALIIFNNHVRVLYLQKNLQKQVLNDHLAYLKSEERYKLGVKESKLTNVDAVNTIQFRPNEDLLVINFTKNSSTNSQMIGSFVILNISSNVKEFLGFGNYELQNQSINKLIPLIYHNIHDKYIDNILQKQDRAIFSRQIRIFPITKNGNVIECNIMSKFMPSITHGINITSFLEKCDKERDEFFLIYDGNTGIVDSMNQQAQLMLKDQSRRKMNDILSIPDHITDLIPNWDYKNQQWKEGGALTPSMKGSLYNFQEINYNIKQIDLIRSDRVDNLKIKIIKFKGDYFMKMFTIQNQSYKQNNSMNEQFNNQKSLSFANSDNKLQSNREIERTRQIKRTHKQRKSSIKVENIFFEEKLPRNSKFLFIAAEVILILAIISIIIFQVFIFSVFFKQFKQNKLLITQINQLQNVISDSTFVVQTTIVAISYQNYNRTLPYNANSFDLFDSEKHYQEFINLLQEVKVMADDLNAKLMVKIASGQLSKDIFSVTVKYLLKEGSKTYYNKTYDIFQAVYQYIQYGKDIIYMIKNPAYEIQNVINSSNYFFIVANNPQAIPSTLSIMKVKIVQLTKTYLQNTISTFITTIIINCVLAIMSIILIKIYYYYILRTYIYKIISVYQAIKIQKIKIFYKKCEEYKKSLDNQGEVDEIQGDSIEHKMTQGLKFMSIPDSQAINTYQIVCKSLKQNPLIQQQEEAMQLASKKNKNQSKGVEYSQFYLNFQQKPKVHKETQMLICWILIFLLLTILASLMFDYSKKLMSKDVQILNYYNSMDNSMIQLRLNTQLILNSVSYWEYSELQYINQQLNSHLLNVISLINNKDLDFSQDLAHLSVKFQMIKYVNLLVRTRDLATINKKLILIEEQIEDMDNINKILKLYQNRQMAYSEQNALKVREWYIIAIVSILLALMMYMGFVIAYYYRALQKIYEFTYEMSNIISTVKDNKK